MKKEQTQEKMSHLNLACQDLEIETFHLHVSGERAENVIFENGQTHKNMRGRKRSERGTSIKHPLSASINNLLEQNLARIKTVFDNKIESHLVTKNCIA